MSANELVIAFHEHAIAPESELNDTFRVIFRIFLVTRLALAPIADQILPLPFFFFDSFTSSHNDVIALLHGSADCFTYHLTSRYSRRTTDVRRRSMDPAF